MEKPGIDLLHLSFYKQPVYKQLALTWQIAKQLSGLNPLSLSNNKNYSLKKNEIFFRNRRKKAVKHRRCNKIQLSQNTFEKILKSLTINIDFDS